jgi:hypothetical protein
MLSAKIRRFLFGIKYFNKTEVKELIILFNEQNFDTYCFKVFRAVKQNNLNKFNFITDDFYYNNLSSKLASLLRRFEKDIKPKNLYEFQNRILLDYLSIEEILKSFEESFSSNKIMTK